VSTLFTKHIVPINVAVKDAAGNTSTITLQVALYGQCIG
jgi:hypothetical protein